MSNELLTLKNLKQYFPVGKDRFVRAVDGVDLTINHGDVMGLVGESGSGKSTIAYTVMGMYGMTGGEIDFEGEVFTKETKRKRSMKFRREAQIVFQDPGSSLNPYQDVRSILSLPLKVHKVVPKNEIDDKILEILEMVELPADFMYKSPNSIGGGEKQLVSIARALCCNPKFIILDEPTSFLDIKHKLDLLSILRDMAKKKQITVIMSLHEIDLAQKIADKIICVKGDTISHFGKPEDIFEENMIKELYEINNGFFDPLFGSIELPKPDGEAKTFVICGNGTGIPIFRQLQKDHTPFIAGILYTNDVDYRLARLLASKVITEEPFMEISEEAFQKAQKAMKSCERIICTAVPVGSCNKRLGELIDAATKSGKTEFV